MQDSTPPLSSSLPQGEREEIADDPEIAALLQFEPVARKNTREDGWSPALQRQFIRHLAASGSPGKACDALGKRRSGIDKLYKVAGADSFRAAWARAVEIAQERQAAAVEAAHAAAVAAPPPFLDHRRKQFAVPSPGPGGGMAGDPDDDMDEDRRAEMVGDIGIKFLKKVAQEREARLAGQIVAADFYLRQVTMLEVMFELMARHIGENPWEMLRELQLCGHGLLQIADTPFARMLDDQRRAFWSANGEPMRPETFKEEFMRDHDDHRTQADQHNYGALSTPARGFSEEQWAEMSFDEQKAARQRQFDEDGAAQVEWEARAHREYEERRASGASS